MHEWEKKKVVISKSKCGRGAVWRNLKSGSQGKKEIFAAYRIGGLFGANCREGQFMEEGTRKQLDNDNWCFIERALISSLKSKGGDLEQL